MGGGVGGERALSTAWVTQGRVMPAPGAESGEIVWIGHIPRPPRVSLPFAKSPVRQALRPPAPPLPNVWPYMDGYIASLTSALTQPT